MEKEIALAFINKFKKIKKPGSAELVSIPEKFADIRGYLKAYFKSLSPRAASVVKDVIIDDKSYCTYSQHYLVALGIISKIFGTYIYMQNKLEDDFPVQRLRVIGNKSEVTIVAYLGKYLLHNELCLQMNLCTNRPKYVNPNAWAKRLRVNFYTPIIYHLKGYLPLRSHTVPLKTSEIKDKFVFEYLLKNLIFDFNDKNINPLYKEHDNTSLDRFKVLDGKWKNKHLLWARDINN